MAAPQNNTYKFIIKVSDITIKSISEGKLMHYPNGPSERLGLLDPYGNSGYQIEEAGPNAAAARQKVISTLKAMGFSGFLR